MRKILAPHHEQDGWRYVRLPSSCTRDYPDYLPGSRMRTSRRAEQDFETGDFLRLCAEEGLCAAVQPDGKWIVYDEPTYSTGGGYTLREAYYRYHAAVNR